jgi:preprotein translocase subunit SecG
MIFTLLMIFHILAALVLILVVLLQVGKGQSIGAAFGGASSSQTFFGSRGPATFLSHMTTGAAALFMLTSLGLTYQYSSSRQSSSLPVQTSPLTEPAPTPALPTVEPAVPAMPATESPTVTPQAVAPPAESSQTPSTPAVPQQEEQQKQ